MSKALYIGVKREMLNSEAEIANSEYILAALAPDVPLAAGRQYELVMDITPAAGVALLSVMVSGGYQWLFNLFVSGSGRQTLTTTFTASYADGMTPADSAAHAVLYFYRNPNDGTVTGNTTVHSCAVRELNATARPAQRMYVGVNTQLPVYEEHEQVVQRGLTAAHLDSFLSWTGVDWTIADAQTPGTVLLGTAAQSMRIINLTTARALADVTLTLPGDMGNAAVYVNNIGVSGVASGGDTVWNLATLPQGTQIEIRAVLAQGTSLRLSSSTTISVTETVREIVGYENREVARRVKRAYVGVNGVARLFYEGG